MTDGGRRTSIHASFNSHTKMALGSALTFLVHLGINAPVVSTTT